MLKEKRMNKYNNSLQVEDVKFDDPRRDRTDKIIQPMVHKKNPFYRNRSNDSVFDENENDFAHVYGTLYRNPFEDSVPSTRHYALNNIKDVNVMQDQELKLIRFIEPRRQESISSTDNLNPNYTDHMYPEVSESLNKLQSERTEKSIFSQMISKKTKRRRKYSH